MTDPKLQTKTPHQAAPQRWRWLVFAVVLLGAIAAARGWQRRADLKAQAASQSDNESDNEQGVGSDGPLTSQQVAERIQLRDTIAERLVEAGWSAEAAATVAELNEDFFYVLVSDDPDQQRRIEGTLARLGKHPRLMRLLTRRPEVAGLLASAPDPSLLAESLEKDNQYDAVSNIYARHGASADQVAAALDRHGSLICHLTNEGFLGAETVFLFPRGTDGAEAYDRWLASAFESASSDESLLAATLQLVMIQGSALRRAMIDDVAFRQEFEQRAWPRLQRLVDAGDFPMELAAMDINLFRVLMLPEGERLVRRWGLVPLELLYGDNAFPPSLHRILVETMLKGDNTALAGLMEFGNEPLLSALLSRPNISAQIKATALSKLHAAGPNYPALLQRYSELSASALKDDVGPPSDGPITWLPLYYTVYEVPKKIIQGRNPTMMDAVIAVLDPVFLFTGPLGPDDAVKVVGQQSAKAAGNKAATQTAMNSLKAAAQQQAVRQIGKQAARVSVKESAPWLVTQAIRGTRSALQRKIQSSLTVDITGPTRMMFKVTGVGRRSFRQLTRLEARIFMRPDRRVLIRLDRFLARSVAGRFLADTAIAGLIETGMQAPEIEGFAVDVTRAAGKFPDQANVAKQKFSAWQKNMSAWWLSQATGLWDETEPRSPVASQVEEE